jgi:hypothetical protein
MTEHEFYTRRIDPTKTSDVELWESHNWMLVDWAKQKGFAVERVEHGDLVDDKIVSRVWVA